MKDIRSLNRQQRWQLKKRADGCCLACGKTRENLQMSRCNACGLKARTRYTPKGSKRTGRPREYEG